MIFKVIFKDISKIKIDFEFISNSIGFIYKDSETVIGNILFIFTSDSYLRKINKKFLQHNYNTDVITFTDRRKNSVGGDIFISLECVRNNCSIYSSGDFEKELKRVIIHGLLHLIGYEDHNVELKTLMREKEEFYLNKILSEQ